MPRSRRPRRTQDKNGLPPEPSPGSGTLQPEPARVQFSTDGMIEDPPAPSWWRQNDPDTRDSRTLAELAASVMSSQQFLAPEAEEDANGQSESSVRPVEAPAQTRVVLTIGERKKPTRRWGTGAIVLLLIVLATMGVAWLRSTLDSSAPASPAGGELVAAPPDGGPPVDGTAPPSSNEAPQEAAPVAAPALPTPAPATAQEPAPSPAPPPAVAPAPTAIPAPAPVPPPPPPAPPPTVHIGDLDGAPKGGKLFVQILVHDSSHNPVAGATVSLAWEGASGPASCVTGAAGSCAVHTNNLSSRANVTLIVTGITVAGGAYEAGSNHDPDGDSSGTSITVGV